MGYILIYKTKEFAELSKKQFVSDAELMSVCTELQEGLQGAKLGGYLYKKRISASGKGKRGGYGVIIGAKIGSDYFFLYIFAKNRKANLTLQEVNAFKALAREYVQFSPSIIESLIAAGELIKIGDL